VLDRLKDPEHSQDASAQVGQKIPRKCWPDRLGRRVWPVHIDARRVSREGRLIGVRRGSVTSQDAESPDRPNLLPIPESEYAHGRMSLCDGSARYSAGPRAWRQMRMAGRAHSAGGQTQGDHANRHHRLGMARTDN
jgi:hypothetical protein